MKELRYSQVKKKDILFKCEKKFFLNFKKKNNKIKNF